MNMNKPDYEVTVQEVEQMMQEALEELKGQDVTKNGGISKMVEQVMNENIFLWQHMTFDLCKGKVYCPANNIDIDIVHFRPHYKEDKRKRDGLSHRLDHVEIIWLKDIDKSLEFCNLSQKLDYDYSKEEAEFTKNKIAELEQKLLKCRESLRHHEDIMRTEKYF